MRLTQRTDYALRALIFLSDRGGAGATAGEIAEAHQVSSGHMLKTMQALRDAGFVTLGRGRGMPSRLASPASSIRIGAVVRALEPLDVVECLSDERDRCELSGGCSLTARLRAARDAFLAELDRTRLSELSTRRSALVALGLKASAS